ncbi:MAG: hypothetical protein LBI35_09430 [Burkholderiales bacterium]|nr:hypothetical protein [Burkholderiales bacterium]
MTTSRHLFLQKGTEMENLETLIWKLEQLIEKNEIPREDGALRQRVKESCACISRHSTELDKQCRKLVTMTDTFYSARKHANHSGGAQTLRANIFSLLRNMHSIAEKMR